MFRQLFWLLLVVVSLNASLIYAMYVRGHSVLPPASLSVGPLRGGDVVVGAVGLHVLEGPIHVFVYPPKSEECFIYAYHDFPEYFERLDVVEGEVVGRLKYVVNVSSPGVFLVVLMCKGVQGEGSIHIYQPSRLEQGLMYRVTEATISIIVALLVVDFCIRRLLRGKSRVVHYSLDIVFWILVVACSSYVSYTIASHIPSGEISMVFYPEELPVAANSLRTLLLTNTDVVVASIARNLTWEHYLFISRTIPAYHLSRMCLPVLMASIILASYQLGYRRESGLSLVALVLGGHRISYARDNFKSLLIYMAFLATAIWLGDLVVMPRFSLSWLVLSDIVPLLLLSLVLYIVFGVASHRLGAFQSIALGFLVIYLFKVLGLIDVYASINWSSWLSLAIALTLLCILAALYYHVVLRLELR